LQRKLDQLLKFRQLRRVEALVRHARGLKPTGAGLILARYARSALSELHRLEDALGEGSGGL
jgi:DNA-binding transcriptional LysR family regulator